MIAALTLTPYAVALGAVLSVVACVLRRRWTGAVSLLLTVGPAVVVTPRGQPDEQVTANGPTVRVLALNMYFGQADARAIVDLVRLHRIDVLALSEFGPSAASALAEAGLPELLPYRVFSPARAAVGSGIASRYPPRRTGVDGRILV